MFIFADGRGAVGEVHLLVISGGRHKWVISKTLMISKKANVWNRNASDIPETLIMRYTIS